MNTALIVGAFALISAGSIFLARDLKAKRLKKEQEQIEYDNEVVPVAVGNNTIYLRRNEVGHFQSLGRRQQRAAVTRFEAWVKKGKYVPIVQQGKIRGYVVKKQL